MCFGRLLFQYHFGQYRATAFFRLSTPLFLFKLGFAGDDGRPLSSTARTKHRRFAHATPALRSGLFALIALSVIVSYGIALFVHKVHCSCCKKSFGPTFKKDMAQATAIKTLAFFTFLLYPGLCLRAVNMFKVRPSFPLVAPCCAARVCSPRIRHLRIAPALWLARRITMTRRITNNYRWRTLVGVGPGAHSLD